MKTYVSQQRRRELLFRRHIVAVEIMYPPLQIISVLVEPVILLNFLVAF